MRETTVYLHNKLGKQKTNFQLDQLSQALELTSSGNFIRRTKILFGIVTFGNTDTKAGYEPQNRYFGLEITESFSEIYSKIIEKAIQNPSLQR
jgi:hypothetical protein